MKLSYKDRFKPESNRIEIQAEIKPVIVLEDGEPLDLFSFVGLDFKVESATEQEKELLSRIFERTGANRLPERPKIGRS